MMKLQLPERRLKKFLNAHPQHGLKISILPWERVERSGFVLGELLKVHLECFNGDCWMGFERGCHVDDLSVTVKALIDQFDAVPR